jgi:hypothetical protein
MKVYIGNWPKNPAKERKVDIRIDKWDTWSMDNTLSLIIEPMLKQLKETQNGHPCLTTHEGCEGCSCETQWAEILDKMIFAFESLNNDYEDQYHSGEMDIVWTPIDAHGNETPDGEYRRMDKGPNDTHKFDTDGWKNHEARIQEGLELFGKYFRSLWT